jgi:cobalamin biosynthesis Mg chelatase CobN
MALAAALAPVALALPALAPQAALAKSCADQIIEQAYQGRITGHFSQACYRAAIAKEGPDTQTYTDVDSTIRAAMTRDKLLASAAVAQTTTSALSSTQSRTPAAVTAKTHAHTHSTPASPPASPPPASPPPAKHHPAKQQHPPAKHHASTQQTQTAVPVSASSSGSGSGDGGSGQAHASGPIPGLMQSVAPSTATGMPVAVIVLGALSLLLVLAGLAGLVIRRRLDRRPPGPDTPLL